MHFILLQYLLLSNEPFLSNPDDGSDCILLGDFNFGDTEENNLIREDFRDAWLELRPFDVGYTVDPLMNTISKVNKESSPSIRKHADFFFFFFFFFFP